MEYFAGLDIMEGTTSASSTRGSSRSRGEGPRLRQSQPRWQWHPLVGIVFETGRMAPRLYQGLAAFGLPVICIESRQAYQALNSLAAHKTDRNDARGLAHLAAQASSNRSMWGRCRRMPSAHWSSREEAGRAVVMLENQIRGLAVVSGPAARDLSPAFIKQALQASEEIDGLSAAMRGLIGARAAVLSAVAPIDADMKKMARPSSVCRRLMVIPGVGKLTALASRPRRWTRALSSVSRHRRLSRPGASSLPVGRGGLRRHRSKCGDRRMRSLLYEAANVMLMMVLPVDMEWSDEEDGSSGLINQG